MGFRIRGQGLRGIAGSIENLERSAFRVEAVLGLGCEVESLGFRAEGPDFRIQGLT